MKVMLIYPPFMSENKTFPPLSLPALTAYLRQRDIEVAQRDLNIEFFHFLAQSRVTSALGERLREVHQAYDRRAMKSVVELQHFCELNDALNAWLPFAASELESHRGILKDIGGRKCAQILEILSSCATLDVANPKDLKEMKTEEFLEELSLERPTVLNNFIESFVLDEVIPFGPGIVGLSLMTELQLFPALTLAWYLKKHAPDIHVTAGGGFVSAVADKIGRRSRRIFSVIDSFIGFDGEVALFELVQCLEKGTRPAGIPNVISFDARADAIQSCAPQESGSLDDLPIPDFEGLDLSLYTRPVIPYYMTKGCSYGRCAYCSDPAYSSARDRNSKLAADQIEWLVNRYKPETLMFVDSYIHPQRLEPVAAELIRRSVKVNWLMQTRLDRFLTTERVELFAESGCAELWFGMETVNKRMIKLIRKGSTKEIIMRILHDCLQNRIKVTLNCLIGFPTETEEEANETISFIDTLSSYYPDLMFKCNTGFVFVPRLAASCRQ